MHFKPVGNPQVAGSHHQMQRQVCDRPNGRERMTSIQTVYKEATLCGQAFPIQGSPRSAAEKYTEDVPKFRQLPCRTFISVGTCPYRERCVYLHDPRLMSRDAKTKTRKKNKEDIVQDSLFWPVLAYQEVSQRLDSSRLPHVIQRYGVPSPHDDQYRRHDQAVYSMWMHFVTFCSLEVIVNPHENEADMNAYLHPGFHKPSNTAERAASLDTPARSTGLFLDDTVAVNPFINVPRLTIFLQMSAGKSAGSISGIYRTPSTSNGRHVLSRQLQCQPSSALSCVLPSGPAMHPSLLHSAALQYPLQLPLQSQVQVQSHSSMSMSMSIPRQLQNPVSRCYSAERELLFSAQERERQAIHSLHPQEQSRAMQPNRINISSTRAYTKEDNTQRHPSFVPPFPYAGNPSQQFTSQIPVQRPFSCFGANGLYSTYPAPGPVSLTLPGHFLESGGLRQQRASASMQSSTESLCADISSPVSVSDRFSPSHSPGPRNRLDQHVLRIPERTQQGQGQDQYRDEESDRQNVQQFNQMVRLRHSSSSSSSGALRGHTLQAISDDSRDLSATSPLSFQYCDEDNTEMSYLDDELQKYFPLWGRQNPSVGCIEPVRTVPYFVMA